MRRFAYERPTTLAEATRLLSEAGEGARLLAGGTDLVVGLRDDTIQPEVVVDLKWIEELRGEAIVVRDGRFTFHALATMTQIEHDVRVLGRLPALAEAARVVGSVQIRNRATLAGNICNGSPAADTVPPQLLHGAIVVIAGPAGERRQSIDHFMLGARRPGPDKRKVDLRPGELVSAIEIPVPPDDFSAAYTRLVRRKGTDLASITLGVSVDGEGVTQVAYGSVGPRAFLTRDESGVLADASADRRQRAGVLDELLRQATPSPRSIRAAPDYRLAMLPVLALRALDTALERRSRSAA
ncbi:MAG: FAD binding domain-containing protein [Candidatus Limnocylindrales bacterium]